VPLDPGRHWLEAGITGLARPREWDAVATVETPGTSGDEALFVALPDGSLLVEASPSGFDAHPFADALDESVDRPYRAVAVRRPELWVVGACAIDVAELADDPGGDEVQLEQLGSARFATHVVRAHRLRGRLFEVAVEPL
jgi:hypothetical protein